MDTQNTLIKRSDTLPDAFNTVIEGSYHDDWKGAYYKIANLQLPRGYAFLDDGSYKYQLHILTKDFSTLLKVNNIPGSLETKINSITFCSGIVLPPHGVFPHILERPRTICTSDGRIYVEEGMLSDSHYVGDISTVIEKAKKIFTDRQYLELYMMVRGRTE